MSLKNWKSFHTSKHEHFFQLWCIQNESLCLVCSRLCGKKMQIFKDSFWSKCLFLLACADGLALGVFTGVFFTAVLSVCYSQKTQFRVGQCRDGLSCSGPAYSFTVEEMKNKAPQTGKSIPKKKNKDQNSKLSTLFWRSESWVFLPFGSLQSQISKV